MSQCIQQSPGFVGWSQGLASPYACIWALVARIAVVFCPDFCRSLPWTDHCFGHRIGSLLSQFSFVDCCFDRLFCQFRTQPFPPLIGSGSPLKFLQCDGAGWWPLAGLVPAHMFAMVPPCCTWYLRGAPTNLGWHQLTSSSIGDEFNTTISISIQCYSNCIINATQLLNFYIF